MIQVRIRAEAAWAVVAAAVLLPTVAFGEVVDPASKEPPAAKGESLFEEDESEADEEIARPEQGTFTEKNDATDDTKDDDVKEDEKKKTAKDKNPSAKKDAAEKATIVEGEGVAPETKEFIEFGENGTMPDDEVVAEACPPSCRPSQDDYAVFDVLFLQRDDATNNQPFAYANENARNPGKFLMTTRSMTPSVAPGVRLVYGRLLSDCTGWEAGYLGVYGMYGDALAGETNEVQIAGELGENVRGFGDATFAEADYWSSLNSIELNAFRSNCFEGCDPCARFACHRCYHRTRVDWLAGFRWASLDEQATLGVIPRAGDRPTPYTVNTSSNLIGLQIGLRGRTEWQQVAFEGGIKTALAGATLSQSQSEIESPITGETERTARSSQAGGVGMISEINLAAVYRINRVWGLRAGYNMLWLSGVALAPSQFDFSFDDDSGLGLDHGAGLFLNGASLGLEARW